MLMCQSAVLRNAAAVLVVGMGTAPHRRRRHPSQLPLARIDGFGAKLLDQQFWLWGQDIRNPHGNQLLARGFIKHAMPAGKRGSHAYSLTRADGTALTVWGFGLHYAHPQRGAILVRRYTFEALPACQLQHPVWQPSQLIENASHAAAESRHALWIDAMDLIAKDEAHAILTTGATLRQAALQAWHKKPCCHARDVANYWHAIRGRLTTLACTTNPHP